MLSVSSVLASAVATLLATSSLSAVVTEANENVVLTPISNSDFSQPDIGVIMLQGADINNTQYEPLWRQVQSAFSVNGTNAPLYVALPQAPLDDPNPGDLTILLKESYNELVKAGMDSSANVFVAGHSLGGAMLQVWVGENQAQYTQKTGIQRLRGQILMGSFIQRKWRSNMTQFLESYEYFIPTATLSGTLDGLCRVTRIAEETYIQVYDDRFTTTNIANYPVFIIKGMSHMQFASGNPPKFVMDHDLKPEISYDEAHSIVGNLISSFMTVQLSDEYPNIKKVAAETAADTAQDTAAQDTTQEDRSLRHRWRHHTHSHAHGNVAAAAAAVGDVVSNSFNLMKSAQEYSNSFAAPLIAGFNAETFYHFIQPCDCHLQICVPDMTVEPYCVGGSYWSVNVVQPTMASLPDGTKSSFVITDSFHPVQQIKPVHLSHIYTDPCDSPQDSSCVLNITTVSENAYDRLDKEDTGFYSTAAYEIRSKLSSRQRVWYYAGYPDAQFNETDTDWNCAQINQIAYNWGLQTADATTLSRYQKYGEKLQMGQDHIVHAGPTWIWIPLRFKKETDPNTGIEYRSVISNVLKTSLDFKIEASAGFHYCKTLSPAKTLEWIYIDGLRYNLSLSTQDNEHEREFYGYSGDESVGFWHSYWF